MKPDNESKNNKHNEILHFTSKAPSNHQQSGPYHRVAVKRKKWQKPKCSCHLMVSKMRLELTRTNVHYPLKVARLPIPPPGHLSEKRDSNPRPRPWQGRALPTELFSHFSKRTP